MYLRPQETTACKLATYDLDRFPGNRFVPRVDLSELKENVRCSLNLFIFLTSV